MQVAAARELDHWAFRGIDATAVPPELAGDPGTSAVDQFVGRKLREHGLTMSRPADRRTLIRRATFDLTGLPPTPQDIAAFIDDESADAFAKVIDRLLASPHYGERWGRHWLDVVRYADTAGETADYPVREAYRYRDYVIAAFNQDKPFDAFVREQIAGDTMARREWEDGTISRERYAELVTATGFLAISRRFGFDTERYEHLTIQDTIDTVGRAVLGLSLGCARCHDHKYDPVSTEDYYGLYGVFASTRYAFAGSERLPATRVMTPLVPPDEAALLWAAWQQRIARLEQQITALEPGFRPPSLPAQLRPLTDLDGDLELQTPPSGGSLGLPANPWVYAGDVRIATIAQSPITGPYPPGTNGAVFAAGQSECFLGRGWVPAFSRWNTPRLEFGVDFRVGAGQGDTPGEFRICLGHGRDQSAAMEFFVADTTLRVRNGTTVETIAAIEPNLWYRLAVTLDADRGTFAGTLTAADGLSVCLTGKSCCADWDGVIDTVLVDGQGELAGPKPGLEIDNFSIARSELKATVDTVDVQSVAEGVETALNDTEQAPLEAWKNELRELLNTPPYPQAYAVWEGTPQDACIQQRGMPEARGPRVARRYLEAFGGDRLPPAAEGSGRWELAHWLTRPDSPLVARVIVNRVWQYHFGQGLVATPNDFGTRGQPPTHPQLLDWLAASLMHDGWSLKQLHRTIMLSHVYQQSSRANADAVVADPENHWLARFSRSRLDAESIRDALLFVSEQLDTGLGGPHPFPAFLQTRYSQHNPFRGTYPTNRRSVYLMTRRLAQHEFLSLFDGADTNSSTARRATSTVPTQALYMLNDPLVHELSAVFAAGLLRRPGSDDERIQWAFATALGRPPGENELADAREMVAAYQTRLAEVGIESDSERAVQSWAAFARTLFASNEFIYID